MIRLSTLMLALVAIGFATAANAYNQYSKNKDATYCRACHGDFRDDPYISLTEGATWTTDLMGVHAGSMLSGDCDTCHQTPNFPVNLNLSDGGTGLPAISCVGCHGRAEDRGTQDDCVGSQNPLPSGCADPTDCPTPEPGEVCGDGAGLRQHHYGAGIQGCADCHSDANPSNFTTATEDVLPPYYSDNDVNHQDIPSDPCNPAADGFPEDYEGSTEGLDNDGDGVYDEADTTFCPEPTGGTLLASGLVLVLGLSRRRGVRLG